MNRLVRYAGQAALYALFAGTIGAHSTAPPYRQRKSDDSILKLSISHAGQVKTPCRTRTAEELARLAPNMRTEMECARERSPIEFVLELDGDVVYRATLQPGGLARDGVSSMYRRIAVPSGDHRLRARLKDHMQYTEFNYAKESDVRLAPGQVMVIDFNARRGGFEFR